MDLMTKYVSSFQRQIFAQTRKRSNHSAVPVYNHFISACRGRKEGRKHLFCILHLPSLLVSGFNLPVLWSSAQPPPKWRKSQRGRGDDIVSVEVWKCPPQSHYLGEQTGNCHVGARPMKTSRFHHQEQIVCVCVWQRDSASFWMLKLELDCTGQVAALSAVVCDARSNNVSTTNTQLHTYAY